MPVIAPCKAPFREKSETNKDIYESNDQEMTQSKRKYHLKAEVGENSNMTGTNT